MAAPAKQTGARAPRQADPARAVTRSGANAKAAALGILAMAAATATAKPIFEVSSQAARVAMPASAYVASRAATRALESTDRPVEAFNAVVHQYMGECGGECQDIDDLERARVQLEAVEREQWHAGAPAAHEVHIFEAMKAAKNEVWVKNADGSTTVHRVPSTLKQLRDHPQRGHWVAADQAAFDTLLINPLNRTVPVSVPRGKGLPIAPCVTNRSLKLCPRTGNIVKYKSRHAYDAPRARAMEKRKGIESFEPTSSTVADDLLIKCTLSLTAEHDLNITKMDVGDAYLKATRQRDPSYMETPHTLPMRSEAGEELCLEFAGTPCWGEAPAGREWQDTLHSGLEADGWVPAELIPCLYTRETTDGRRAILITIVDDILIAETGDSYDSADLALTQLQGRYGEVKSQREPDSFVGYTILRDRERRALTINMAEKIEATAKEHIPEYLEHGSLKKMGIPEGAKLRKMAEDMTLEPMGEDGKAARTPHSRIVQSIAGKVRWYEKCDPELTKGLHCLSCVATRAPPEAVLLAKAMLALAYDNRRRGITYGGGGLHLGARLNASLYASFRMSDGPTKDLECTADATWDGDNVYSVLITLNGGAIVHICKKMHLIVDSSMESEALASGKAGEAVGYAREIMRALGFPVQGPTFVGTDNAANAMIASGRALPARSRHCLRRYLTFLQRVRQGDVEVGHVRDVENPADFLTKFVSKEKIAMSVKYATNSSNCVEK